MDEIETFVKGTVFLQPLPVGWRFGDFHNTTPPRDVMKEGKIQRWKLKSQNSSDSWLTLHDSETCFVSTLESELQPQPQANCQNIIPQF